MLSYYFRSVKWIFRYYTLLFLTFKLLVMFKTVKIAVRKLLKGIKNVYKRKLSIDYGKQSFLSSGMEQ